ncbi:MAG: DUF6526 family protein [Bacteroidetes bacterium]|nr:DUF6526 family protein [Bacteroidota bacterium]
MKKQNYANHRRYIFLFHFFLLGLISCALIGSIVNLTESIDKEGNIYSASLILVVNIILMMGFFFFRNFSLRAQDRAIRAEENFRHFLLTGKPLDTRLHMNQVIALRFAPDDEFVPLAKEAADKQLTSEEIKKAIRRWRGDYHRA